MSANWRSEEDEILIDFVRAHEILYNIKHKDYRKTQIKEKLWRDVGKIVNKTYTDCIKRWGYVRDYYIRRKGKINCSSGEAAKKRADLLSFLDGIPSTQRRSFNYAFEEVEMSEENSQESTEQKPFLNQETEDMTFNNEGDISTDAYYTNDESKGDSGNIEDNINNKFQGDVNMKKRKKDLQAQEQLNLLKQSTQNELDETDLFFSSMAKIVKRLPRYEQTTIRMQIGSIVGNAELRYIPTDSPSSSLSTRPSKQ